jgi:CheY-like chemotaxis protein
MLGIGTLRNLPTVLVIDDDMVSREVMATVLTMSGYTVHTATGGDEALLLLDSRDCEPEIILMDTQMPGLSGAGLIEQLRARSRATVIAISGSEVPSSVADGADGFLMKPFDPEALQRLLEQKPATSGRAQGGEAPVINPKVLAQLREMMKESAVREIYRAVVADLEKRRPMLDIALMRGDPAEVHRIGHSIKGGCGMAGALALAHVGEMIENAGGNLEYVRSLLPRLDSAVSNLKQTLESEFSAPEPGSHG